MSPDSKSSSNAFDANPHRARRARSYYWWPVVGLAVGLALVGLAGRNVYYSTSDDIRKRAGDQLLSIADLKVDRLEDWSIQRADEVSVFHRNPAFSELFARDLASGEELSADSELMQWLERAVAGSSFRGVVVLDEEHRVVAETDGTPVYNVDHAVSEARGTPDSQVSFMDFHESPDASVHLSFLVPVVDLGGDRGRLGTLVFVVDPDDFLYPLLQGWPIPSESGETMLIRREGEDALFLNELRFADEAAMNLRVPVARTDVIAAMAALGEEGLVEGEDYRGINVIAAVRKVPDSPWHLVAKLDTSEALADLDDRLGAILTLTAAGAALVTLLAALLWRNARAGYYKRLHEAESGRRASRERFRLLAENLPAASYLCRDDEAWTMLYLNDRIEAITGHSPQEFIDEIVSYAELCHSDDVPGIREAVEQSRKTGMPFFANYRITDASGSERWIEEYGQALNEDGEDLLLGVIFDITERVRAAEELDAHRQQLELLVEERTQDLAAMNEELDSTNEELQSTVTELEQTNEELESLTQELQDVSAAKSTFIASMSHELRTPLNSIIGFSGVILSGATGEINEEQAHQIGMINTSGKNLLAIINDILDLAKIEARKLTLDITEFDAAGILTEVVETLAMDASKKGIEIHVEDSPGPIVLVSDEGRLRQILMNLAGNAVKFTEHGEIRLSVCQAKPGMVCFRVADTGPGIPEDRQPEVFQPFTQIRGGSGAKPPGTGLGLSISTEYAHLLGGTIEVSSEPQRGSEFRVVLPVRHGDGIVIPE